MITPDEIKPPDEVWIIFDSVDGHHVYGSKAVALLDYKRWEKDAQDDPGDPFWKMTKPTCYTVRRG